jgi:chromosomal replication initiator protein
MAQAARRRRRPSVGIDAIQEAVCDRFGVSFLELLSPRRLGSLVDARHAAVWLARQAGYSLPAIGRAFDRDHTTVLHAVGRVDRLLASDPGYAAAVARVAAALKADEVGVCR